MTAWPDKSQGGVAPQREGRVGHHRPGQRDHHGYSADGRPEGAGVAVAAEDEAGVDPGGLGGQTTTDAQHDHAGSPSGTAGTGRVDNRGRGEKQHRRYCEIIFSGVRDQGIRDLGGDGGSREGPWQKARHDRSRVSGPVVAGPRGPRHRRWHEGAPPCRTSRNMGRIRRHVPAGRRRHEPGPCAVQPCGTGALLPGRARCA